MTYKSLVSLALVFVASISIVTPFITLTAHATNSEDKLSFMEKYKVYSAAAQGDASDTDLAQQAQNLALAAAVKFGETHQNTINLTISAANHYRDAKKHEEAMTLYDSALALYQKADSEESSGYLFLLAELLKAQDILSYSDRKRITKDAIEALSNYLENGDNQEILNNALPVYDAIASSGASDSGTRKIRALGETLLVRANQYFAADDLRLVRLQFMHAKVLGASGKRNDAIEYFSKVIESTDNKTDFTHPFALASHAQLVNLFEDKNESEAATEHCIAIGRMRPWQDNEDPVPLFRKNPEYPINYARKDQEGWALLSFDITPFGFVDNVEVVEVSGGKKFGESSADALSAWRYAPKFEDGKAVLAKNNHVRIDFTLDQGKSKLKNL